MNIIPQTSDPFVNALREYEAVHAEYMNTAVHTPAFNRIKSELQRTRENYIAEYKRRHPDHIVF